MTESKQEQKRVCALADAELQPRAYFSINSPGSAIMLVGAIMALVIYVVQAEVNPTKTQVRANRDSIVEIKSLVKDTNDKLEDIKNLLIEKGK